MSTSYINIDGKQTSSANTPSRLFRDSWVLDANTDVVSVDLTEAKLMAHGVRSEWFKWRSFSADNPVSHDGKFFWSDTDSGSLVDGECGYARDVEEANTGSYSLTPGWKAIDETFYGPLDFDGIKALKAAYRNHYNTAFTASQVKAAEIEAAADEDALLYVVNTMKSEIGEDA